MAAVRLQTSLLLSLSSVLSRIFFPWLRREPRPQTCFRAFYLIIDFPVAAPALLVMGALLYTYCRSPLTATLPTLTSNGTRRLRRLRFCYSQLRLSASSLLFSLFRTCVYPSLSWGAPLWTPFAVRILDDPGTTLRLEQLHHSILHWILRVSRTCLLELLYHELGAQPQFIWLWLLTLRYFVHLRSLPADSCAAQAL